ncbi:MAG: hypothetical protein WEB13_03015 [Dehalococcoidia bacterium]
MAADVGAGDHGVVAGERRGRTRVGADDARVRAMAVQQAGGQHPGEALVGGVQGAPGRLLDAVYARRRLADRAAVDHARVPFGGSREFGRRGVSRPRGERLACGGSLAGQV